MINNLYLIITTGTYRWRGRNDKTNLELNPLTLTSGFDDYPRASHPTKDERHVDLRCWIAFAAGTMAEIADVLERDSKKYKDTFNYLSDNKLLDKLHRSPSSGTYSDYGLHTDKIILRRPAVPPNSNLPNDMIRLVLEEPTLRFVDSNFGYVSLFPFLLQIIDPSSPHLEKLLNDLTNKDLLWTDFGLRSLAKNSPLYMKHNSEHNPPYWRGAVWINVNYLAARALHHYSQVTGPYQDKARKIHEELKQNIIKNVIKQYNKSGYIWENYDDSEGTGKGSHPFTGWSSLTLLLMADIY